MHQESFENYCLKGKDLESLSLCGKKSFWLIKKDMKKLTFLAVNGLLLFFTIVVHAQQLTFSKVLYDSLQYGIQAHSVVATVDNGYLIVGEALYQNGIILKMDSAGNLVWNKIFQDAVLNNIITTNDSCFVLVGKTTTGQACCIKIKSNGDTIWSKAITCSGYNINALSVQQTNDSGYIMTGNTDETNAPYSRVFAAKLNVTGDLEWTTILTGGNNSNLGYSVKQTPDSGYVIAGSMVNYPPYDPNAFLLKLASNGVLSWAKKYYLSTTADCYGNDVIILDNGFLCYLNTGYTTTLMRTDFTGNILWRKSYYEASGNNSYGTPTPKLHKTSDNGYVFVSGNGGGCLINGILTKTDSIGNVIWAKSLSFGAVDVIASENKEFFVVGNGPLCGVKAPQVFSPQIGIIKTDSLGSAPNCISSVNIDTAINNLISSSAIFTATSGATETSIYPDIYSIAVIKSNGCVELGSGIHESKLDNVISVYPNPSNGIFKFQSNESKPYKINVYNTLGEKIYSSGLLPLSKWRGDGAEVIDLTVQPKGIYFYQAIFSNNKFATGKLIIK